MPLKKLQKQIIDDAWRRADSIEDDARRQAESIIRQAREKASEIKRRTEREARQEIAMEKEEEEANAELLEKLVLLDARGGALEAVMPRLERIVISTIKRRGYDAFIRSAVEEAGGTARQDDLTMIINKGDAKFVKNFDGRIRYGETGSGVEFVSKDGRVRMRAALEDMFEAKRKRIETLLMREMFRGGRAAKRAKGGDGRKRRR